MSPARAREAVVGAALGPAEHEPGPGCGKTVSRKEPFLSKADRHRFRLMAARRGVGELLRETAATGQRRPRGKSHVADGRHEPTLAVLGLTRDQSLPQPEGESLAWTAT
jgi:hypothetical protein